MRFGAIAVAAVVLVLLIIGVVWHFAGSSSAVRVSNSIGITNNGVTASNTSPQGQSAPAISTGGPPPAMTIALPRGHAAPIVVPVTHPAPNPANTNIWATAVAVDARGHVWAGVEDQPLSVMEPSLGEWTTVKAINGNNDAIISLACDRQGRVWAGHAYNGVSVFNGREWKSYGLLDGPLGGRVNDIEISPVDGDVWLATNRGITRYSVASNTWSYQTRGDGLPSDDIVAVALDDKGTIYAATADSGITVGTINGSSVTWRSVQCTADNRALASGTGLASNWCNDVRVLRDGTVAVASIEGVSLSRDRGATWRFIRGEDWLAKAQSAASPLEIANPSAIGVLAEDAVTCLGEDAAGKLLVGHLRKPIDIVDPKTLKLAGQLAIETTCAYGITTTGSDVWVASFGKGIVNGAGRGFGPDAPPEEIDPAAKADDIAPAWLGREDPPPLPLPASAPNVESLVTLRGQLAKLPAVSKTIGCSLGTDWVTGGDCIGRYGWDLYALPFYGHSGRNPDYRFNVGIGPHKSGDGVYTYWASTNSDDPRHLFILNNGKRMQGEWNDASWQKNKYPYEAEGPDLLFHVGTPAGLHRVSLYVINNDGHSSSNRCRDFLLELKADDGAGPTLATARARRFGDGFYAQFLVGEGKYQIKVGRNGSHGTKVSALFIDRVDAPASAAPAKPGGPPLLFGVDFRPTWDGKYDASGKPTLEAAMRLWQSLDADRARNAPADTAYRLLAYRAIAGEQGTESMLPYLRYHLPLWTDEDRQAFADGVAEAHARLKKQNPDIDKDDK